MNNLCLTSFNTRGFSDHKQDLCKFLLSPCVNGNKVPVLCNQEHFLLKANCYKIKQALPGYLTIINPAKKDTHDKGRPKGGMFMAVPDAIKNLVVDISPGFWRTQAIILKMNSSRILIINSYFPTDPGTIAFNDSDLLETLETIRKIINNNDFHHLFWLGDINADFLRRSGHVTCVKNFLEDLKLLKAWDRFPIDFTHYQEVGDVTHTSTVDHIVWNEASENMVDEAGVVHIPENTSDHCPVFCVVNVGQVSSNAPAITPHVAKPSWKKATAEQKHQYTNNLEANLLNIQIPQSLYSCCDVHCSNTEHCIDADNAMIEILDCIEKNSYENLPVPPPPRTKKSKPNLPGWSDEIATFRDDAYFWHQVWISSGKQLNTDIHLLMKKSRNVYHYQIRKLKKAKDTIAKNKFLEACLDGQKNIFQEIKKLRKEQPTVANSMDGVENDIPNHFKSIYSDLYNSVEDSEELLALQDSINERINVSSLYDVRKVSPEVVKEAAHNLQDSKTDPCYNFSSDCIKNGPDILFKHLSIIIQAFLIHGSVTLFLLLATLVPIVKDKLGKFDESKNYRSIAMSCLILKIFDWIILLLFSDSLSLDDLQFAYQSRSSTSMCTWAAIETINYFSKNGSDVFTCLMDMTKAFDMVKHSLLFKKLLSAGLPKIFVRLLLYIYINQFANVRWNGSFSSIFSISNGVRQGAILSGIFYCFYTNDLFNILRKRRTGCWVNGVFMGIFGYSDDNFLVAPSLDALQEMLVTCQEYAEEHNLKFSTHADPIKCKTKCISFLIKERSVGDVNLCGVPLPWVKAGKHLGNHLSNKCDGMKSDIRVKRAMFIDKNNDLNQEFNFCHPRTKVKMNLIYNFHFTGSPLWDLFSPEAAMIENTWNTAVRIMFDLPFNTHRFFIETISETKHLKTILLKRFLSFLQQIRSSPKTVTSQLLEFIKRDTRSTTGSNLRNLLLMTNKDDIDDITFDDVENMKYCEPGDQDKWKVDFTKEIISIKNNELQLENFTKEEIDEILDHLCSS